MIKRELELPKNHSFFLFGPRQTGKSTLLKTLFSKETTRFYDFLTGEDFFRFSEHPALFREEVESRPAHITHIVLDEVQRLPFLLDEVHSLIESPNPPCFLMTGSSARQLKRGRANLLAGRAWVYHLFSLAASELGRDFSIRKALSMGTLPSVYLSPSPQAAIEILRAYVMTYLKEEIELEAQVRKLGQFTHFLTIAGHENGNTLNYSNIARETGTSYQTVKSYFQILEDTLIGSFLYPYRKSLRKRLSKHPKFYFFDCGVTRAITKQLGTPLEPRTSDFGRAFEQFVVLEVMRHDHYHKQDFTFSFYRTESGAEVDLIVETPKGVTIAIEIKATDAIDSSHLRGLKSFRGICPKARLCCVSLAPYPIQKGTVSILPWQELLPWLEQF